MNGEEATSIDLLTYRIGEAEKKIIDLSTEQKTTREAVLLGLSEVKAGVVNAISDLHLDIAGEVRKVCDIQSKDRLDSSLADEELRGDIGKLKQSASILGAAAGMIVGPLASIIFQKLSQ